MRRLTRSLSQKPINVTATAYLQYCSYVSDKSKSLEKPLGLLAPSFPSPLTAPSPSPLQHLHAAHALEPWCNVGDAHLLPPSGGGTPKRGVIVVVTNLSTYPHACGGRPRKDPWVPRWRTSTSAHSRTRSPQPLHIVVSAPTPKDVFQGRRQCSAHQYDIHLLASTNRA